jgi:hypothetical protein
MIGGLGFPHPALSRWERGSEHSQRWEYGYAEGRRDLLEVRKDLLRAEAQVG